ncbi:hypothetical protein [uncultured Brevibacillus sp.]|uniref:hypothetical protein n=1 Tax=uncultured Brevibacillus sp. TaxID=169970 RepID=UPI0025979603|nr:hypothetical protein [uncultured Brevibacillus sp.]
MSVLWNAAQQKGEIYSAFSNKRKYSLPVTQEPIYQISLWFSKVKVGAMIRRGDLIFERIENASHAFPEKVDAVLANTSQTHLIKKSEGEEYGTIWIKNESSRQVIFTVTKDSPSGTVIPGSIMKIPAQTTWTISIQQPLMPRHNFANFTSGQAIMLGKVAFTFHKNKEEL